MINEKTILSSFDDKETLLKWLKKTEKALAESILQSITPIETSDGYFNLKFNFKDGTSIETPTAIQLKGYKGDKGDTGPRGEKGDPLAVGVIPSGTNILEFDFTPYGSGSLFIGRNLQGMPEEINPEHSEVVVQLIRNNSTLYCLKVFNTGLYQGNQGEYTIYHYATSYAGWQKVSTSKGVKLDENNNIVLSHENTPLNIFAVDNLKRNEYNLNGIQSLENKYFRTLTGKDLIQIDVFNQNYNDRCQISLNTDAIIAEMPSFYKYSVNLLGNVPSPKGLTNCDFTFKLLKFVTDKNIRFYITLGNYAEGLYPSLEFLNIFKLPSGVTISKNFLNSNKGTHFIEFTISNTILNPIILHAHVEQGIAYFYLTEETSV